MSDAAMFACAPLDSCLNFATHCSACFRVNMDTVLVKIVKPSGLGPLARPDEVPTVGGSGMREYLRICVSAHRSRVGLRAEAVLQKGYLSKYYRPLEVVGTGGFFCVMLSFLKRCCQLH